MQGGVGIGIFYPALDGQWIGPDVTHVEQQAVVLGKIPVAVRRFQHHPGPRGIVLAVHAHRHAGVAGRGGNVHAAQFDRVFRCRAGEGKQD